MSTNELTFTLYGPLSTNHAYTTVGNHNKVVLTKDGKQWKNRAAEETMSEALMAGFRCSTDDILAVEYAFTFPDNHRRDIANYEKLMTDAMMSALAIDDSQIWDMHLRRLPNVKGQITVQVTIRKLDYQQELL